MEMTCNVYPPFRTVESYILTDSNFQAEILMTVNSKIRYQKVSCPRRTYPCPKRVLAPLPYHAVNSAVRDVERKSHHLL